MGLPEQLNMLKWRPSFPAELPRAVMSFKAPSTLEKSPLTALNSQLGRKKKRKDRNPNGSYCQGFCVRGVFCSGLRLSDSLVSAGLWLPSPGRVRRGFTDLSGRSPSFWAAGWGSAMATILPGSLWIPVKEAGAGDQESSGSNKRTIIFFLFMV